MPQQHPSRRWLRFGRVPVAATAFLVAVTGIAVPLVGSPLASAVAVVMMLLSISATVFIAESVAWRAVGIAENAAAHERGGDGAELSDEG